ncbi:hypothetical protein BC827DRAFT_544130 [Russula dissimulans]|nr:hypothetical protein BC827DRAFT_544130 [Russula dissimulans]
MCQIVHTCGARTQRSRQSATMNTAIVPRTADHAPAPSLRAPPDRLTVVRLQLRVQRRMERDEKRADPTNTIRATGICFCTNHPNEGAEETSHSRATECARLVLTSICTLLRLRLRPASVSVTRHTANFPSHTICLLHDNGHPEHLVQANDGGES